MFNLVLIAIISTLCIGEGTTTMSKEIINRLDSKTNALWSHHRDRDIHARFQALHE